ncbi:aldehyde dehydrogenase family protein [uncultured Jatrophihabitans sp.]|uniref:aldehyde dehydrogenase family protein n=1 Tax=uncultured Jatrophihabitans sp. TaxID=1610747 RepID=UPI0035C9E45F
MTTLNDHQPLVTSATSGGVDLATSRTFDVVNPATGGVFAQAPAVTAEQLDEVFDVALTAQAEWKLDDQRRCEVLRAAVAAIEGRVPELARLLTLEQGKPLSQSSGEFAYAAAWLRYFADLEIPREIVRDDEQAFQEVIRRPMGVVSAITPWNFPILLAMWKIAPALRAGNTVVVKPSPYTPLSMLALGNILREVLPAGVLNVVAGLDPLGAAMVSHPVPRKVSFTGSTAVGRQVAVAAAADLKRVTLELGGNDPAVILEDVDVETVAQSLFASGFANNGQMCVAVKRVYAHESIQPRLVEALTELARAAKVGDGTLDGTEFGPLASAPQHERVMSLVTDAVSRGARVTAGGSPLDRDGYFFPPTILDQISDGVRVVDEEQFGPVLPVLTFRDEADAIARANRSEYGLTASVWSSDPERAADLALAIDAGQVSINAHAGAVLPNLPFGGHKHSGIGVENGPWGLHEYTDLQVIAGPSRRGRS